VYDLSTANSYLMSMNVSVCTQTPCEQTYVVLDNVLLPKLQCTWNATFSNTGKLSELLPRSKYYCKLYCDLTINFYIHYYLWPGQAIREFTLTKFAIPVFQMLQFCNSDCKIGILVFGIW
jgi:hypothetical protein